MEGLRVRRARSTRASRPTWSAGSWPNLAFVWAQRPVRLLTRRNLHFVAADQSIANLAAASISAPPIGMETAAGGTRRAPPTEPCTLFARRVARRPEHTSRERASLFARGPRRATWRCSRIPPACRIAGGRRGASPGSRARNSRDLTRLCAGSITSGGGGGGETRAPLPPHTLDRVQIARRETSNARTPFASIEPLSISCAAAGAGQMDGERRRGRRRRRRRNEELIFSLRAAALQDG